MYDHWLSQQSQEPGSPMNGAAVTHGPCRSILGLQDWRRYQSGAVAILVNPINSEWSGSAHARLPLNSDGALETPVLMIAGGPRERRWTRTCGPRRGLVKLWTFCQVQATDCHLLCAINNTDVVEGPDAPWSYIYPPYGQDFWQWKTVHMYLSRSSSILSIYYILCSFHESVQYIHCMVKKKNTIHSSDKIL